MAIDVVRRLPIDYRFDLFIIRSGYCAALLGPQVPRYCAVRMEKKWQAQLKYQVGYFSPFVVGKIFPNLLIESVLLWEFERRLRTL